METFCINCDRKLSVLNDTYPLWNRSNERFCSKCRNKADFFVLRVHSHESALDFYSESVQKLLEKDFSPKAMQHLEDYCKYLDKVDAPPTISSPGETTENKPVEINDISPDSSDSEKVSRDNFIKSLFKSENTVAKILTVIALIFFIAGFIGGFVFGGEPVYNFYGFRDGLEFSLRIAIIYWVSSFISGMFFIGLAEVIKLLQKISDK